MDKAQRALQRHRCFYGLSDEIWELFPFYHQKPLGAAGITRICYSNPCQLHFSKENGAPSSFLTNRSPEQLQGRLQPLFPWKCCLEMSKKSHTGKKGDTEVKMGTLR